MPAVLKKRKNTDKEQEMELLYGSYLVSNLAHMKLVTYM